MWKSLKRREAGPAFKTNLHRFVTSWTRGSRVGPRHRDIRSHRAYRAGSAAGLDDHWETRIAALSDGRSVADIVEELFKEEAMAGAWLVDIALWRSIFEQSVTRTVDGLARRGYIFLTPG